MRLNLVNLADGGRVLLIDDFFEPKWINLLQKICGEFQHNKTRWPVSTITQSIHRRMFNESGKDWEKFVDYIKRSDITDTISQALNISMSFSMINLWCDQTGFGALLPHREQGGKYMAQIYITDQSHDWGGTTVYNEQKEILFQMPYRNNYAWFFDDGTTVMHGRHHDVPAGLDRFTLQIWWGAN